MRSSEIFLIKSLTIVSKFSNPGMYLTISDSIKNIPIDIGSESATKTIDVNIFKIIFMRVSNGEITCRPMRCPPF